LFALARNVMQELIVNRATDYVYIPRHRRNLCRTPRSKEVGVLLQRRRGARIPEMLLQRRRRSGDDGREQICENGKSLIVV